jgi:hypothetical protein
MDKAMNNLKPLADEYGEINAQMADLKKRQKSIKEVFAQADVKELEGLTFRIVVSQVEDSSCPDYKTICEKLEPSRQMIAANQKVTKGYTRINVYGRTGDE